MLENMRWAHYEAARLLAELMGAAPEQRASPEQLAKINQLFNLREMAVRWAAKAAPYCHPQLAAVAHRHANADGSPLVPNVTICCRKTLQCQHDKRRHRSAQKKLDRGSCLHASSCS
jgi:hypothetical protein